MLQSLCMAVFCPVYLKFCVCKRLHVCLILFFCSGLTWNIQWRWSLYIHILHDLLLCHSSPYVRSAAMSLHTPLQSWWWFRKPNGLSAFFTPQIVSVCWGEWYHNEYKGWMFPYVTVLLVDVVCNITHQISLIWMTEIERINTVSINVINWSKLTS